jgi:hypothetical protein
MGRQKELGIGKLGVEPPGGICWSSVGGQSEESFMAMDGLRGVGRTATKRTYNANPMDNQVALSPVFPVSPVVVLTVPVRLLSVTCAVAVACSPLPRPGASGTSRSTRDRSMFGHE